MIQVVLETKKILDSQISRNKLVELDKCLSKLPTKYRVWPEALFTGFQLKGHAEQAEFGHDIICAAATNQAATCISALTDLAGIEDLQYQLIEGLISCQLRDITNLNSQQLLLSQVIFAQFYLGLEQIACSEQAQDGNYIEVIAPILNRKR